jgi:hypothetical protein
MKTATSSWPQTETDPQRVEILAAADRLLAGTPTRSTGNLSIVQLAVEANAKYWVVAQKHTDLRDHFQHLAVQSRQTATVSRDNHDAFDRLRREHADLRKHCDGLEQLLRTYSQVINEISLENEILRDRATGRLATVSPMQAHREPKPGAQESEPI